MRFPLLFVAAVSTALASDAAAQRTRIYAPPPPGGGRGFAIAGGEDAPRAGLGITTSSSASPRDTLGLLVSSVSPDSPAERAGIQEGNRIAAINGVNLRVSPDDAGDWEMGNAMSRRLTRELSRLRPGDDVELRVYSSGSTRTVRLRTADSDSLYGRRRVAQNREDVRASLGIGLGATGSRRDTLGVLVMFVDDDGPAGKAGIEEGNRIASIGDTDLRLSREDAGEGFVASTKVQRLQREVANLRPGDEVELRVYANGRFRTVTLRAARASDLPRRHRGFMITGDGMGMLHGMPDINGMVDGQMIGGEVRRAIERAMEASGRAFEGMGRDFGRRFEWNNDRREDQDNPDRVRIERIDPERIRIQRIDPDRARIERLQPRRIEPIEPIRVEPLAPMRARSVQTANSVRAATARARVNTTFQQNALAASAAAMRDDASAVNVGGLRLVPIGASLATYLGRGSERGLLVIEVPSWARGAIETGDVVLRVDGQAVRDASDPDSVNFELPRFRDATLDVMRDGRVRAVTLPARR
jgi:C-terminal processing protease CtpA/Prc